MLVCCRVYARQCAHVWCVCDTHVLCTHAHTQTHTRTHAHTHTHTHTHTFGTKQNATMETKANLLGATVLVDFAWFESQNAAGE